MRTGSVMSPWSQETVVTKVPSVPVIISVSVSPQSQGGSARVYFKTDNSDICQSKLIGQHDVTEETVSSCGRTCCYQARLINFSLPPGLPCEEHRVTVRCRNRLSLDKVGLLRPVNPLQYYHHRTLKNYSKNDSNTSICRRS